jgi:hypothetical protein
VCSPRSRSKHSSITKTFDRYGHLLPGMDEALAEEWMGSDERPSWEGIAWDAMTHIRWGRALEHAMRSAGLP